MFRVIAPFSKGTLGFIGEMVFSFRFLALVSNCNLPTRQQVAI